MTADLLYEWAPNERMSAASGMVLGKMRVICRLQFGWENSGASLWAEAPRRLRGRILLVCKCPGACRRMYRGRQTVHFAG